MKNEILDIPNESTLDNNESNIDSLSVDNISQNSILDETQEELNLNKDDEINNNIDTTTNCLALTVRENYHIVVVKNFFKKTFRVSWKVALSIITINFLNMFL